MNIEEIRSRYQDPRRQYNTSTKMWEDVKILLKRIEELEKERDAWKEEACAYRKRRWRNIENQEKKQPNLEDAIVQIIQLILKTLNSTKPLRT